MVERADNLHIEYSQERVRVKLDRYSGGRVCNTLWSLKEFIIYDKCFGNY